MADEDRATFLAAGTGGGTSETGAFANSGNSLSRNRSQGRGRTSRARVFGDVCRELRTEFSASYTQLHNIYHECHLDPELERTV
jgi:hypothetical protein